ncbi:bifunctional proline dehydrogenase/L-glutamate gamma-semialdehyde dehydrogenase [Aeromicrobium sp. CF3.5]|uniref:bifunctional proline dehydrogenase/L-glutamate gamma-semialdehyde dehydrogenase n=1 Tax=Aeromicrobium sp. CF3.5 TaxID=3373078 RepID=UPI003EE5F962
MSPNTPAASTHADHDLDGIEDPVLEQVRAWLAASADVPVDASAARLAGLLKDPKGLPFTVGFVDGVIRPEDVRVAARALAALARDIPAFIPWHLRGALRLGAFAGRFVPGVVIPVARRVLRHMVGHLVIDAREAQLGRAVGRIRKDGTRLNVNLLGEAVLGEREAARRLEGTRTLLARDDIDYVSIKVSSVIGPHSVWAFDEAVEHIIDTLTPLYQLAASSPKRTFINLDMEEYRDLDLTMAVFMRILDRPELNDLEAGIVLQAYLPDSLAAMIRLQTWAAARRADGGAAIKVRVVKGANLPMERVEAELHDWPLATWSSKQASDTHYKRVLNYAFDAERIENVRVGVAGHNLFDIAFAWVLAGRRGVRDGLEFEMLLGMAQEQAAAVRDTVGGLLLYTPVVHPREFDVAIAYLIRRLEEGASADNFMSAVFELTSNDRLLERERARFMASLADLDTEVPLPNRRQDRRAPIDESPMTGFENIADTDPSLPGNRAWGRGLLERIDTSQVGEQAAADCNVTTREELEVLISGTHAAATSWAQRSGAERAAVLRCAAVELERRRGELAEVMGSECGKTLDQSDPEISEAIDFANFYAQGAVDLELVDGAVAVPVKLTVVTPPWNFPVAIPAGSTLAALAAGSAVIIKPAAEARRCGAVMVEALWAAGVPREVLAMVQLSESELGQQLVGDPRIDRLILTGAYETAELFRSFRTDLPLLAETSGKNAIIVTPSADLDLAAKDVASSAFGHAGQKCSAASLVILVGSVAESRRFNDQLVDAVQSLTVGRPSDPATQMGPLIAPAEGKLLDALTVLAPGERWVVEPTRLDDDGQLWSPGVKAGVARGSQFHLVEYFGPVLGIMHAASLEEAMVLQNEVDYGLTAGIHSLDADEIETWLDTVQAGNLYVNRGITGAIVRRQPFGGWKKSAVGPGTKAGGPNYLMGLVDWASAPATAGADLGASALGVQRLARDHALDEGGLEVLDRSLRSDALAWTEEFSRSTDESGLSVERNVFRYRATQTGIRVQADVPLAQSLRIAAAGLVAGAAPWISFETDPGGELRTGLTALGLTVSVEADAAWFERFEASGLRRARVLGMTGAEFAAGVQGRPDLAAYTQPVLEAGRVELLPFLVEQAVSITAHRFGTPNDPVGRV